MEVVAQKKSDCKSLLQGEVHVQEKPLSCRKDISRKDISAWCPDRPLLLPPLSFPTLCVEWQSLALADVKIEFLTGETLYYMC